MFKHKSYISVPVYKQQQDCVKRRATLSLTLAGFEPQIAQDAIDDTWETCYNDHAPFFKVV